MQSTVLAMIDSVCLSVCLFVYHSPVSCQNDSNYDHAVFALSFFIVNINAKFQKEHREGALNERGVGK